MSKDRDKGKDRKKSGKGGKGEMASKRRQPDQTSTRETLVEDEAASEGATGKPTLQEPDGRTFVDDQFVHDPLPAQSSVGSDSQELVGDPVPAAFAIDDVGGAGPSVPAEPSEPAVPPSVAPVAARARGGRPVTPEDLARIRVVGEPAISPDGHYVAVSVSQADLEEDGYTAAIWLVPTANDGGEPRQLTAGSKRDTSPVWSPDGSRLLFVSDRDTKAGNLWIIPATSGEARRVTDLENGVSTPVWAPDGRHVAFISAVTPEDNNPGSDAKLIRDVRYKFDGKGFVGGKRDHLFTVDVDSGATPEQVTDGPYDHRSLAWAPSGRELAFAANRNPGWETERTSDIWTVVPGAAPRRITDGAGQYGRPSFSPDGRWLAYTGTDDLELEAPDDDLWVVAASGGSPRRLTEGYDRSIANGAIGDTATFPAHPPAWTADGRSILIVVGRDGEAHVQRISVPETGPGRVTPVTAGWRQVGAFALDPTVAGGTRLAIAVHDPVTPPEIHLVEAGREERVLTRFNEELFRELALSLPEELAVEHGGVRVQSWLMRSSGSGGTTPGVKVPAVLEIHGGPHAMYGWSYFHEFQVLASRGYAVIFANPQGSTGYEQTFTEALRGAWGEVDHPQQMAAVDAAVAHGNLDPARLGVAGGSYGGFMTNWVIGHDDRFRAAVTQRTISNMYSMYGTDDIAVISMFHELGGAPWDTPELARRYLELSPITYVKDMTTPLLILHAEEDYRCPMEQAEQLYLALKQLGREVEFVRFPDESHGLTRGGKPKHRIEHMTRLVGWFDQHL
jgi:dipeptidyl aminopeptidase/acylaminoacyl peptidase